MRYMATIYISDVMDQVAATLELQGWESHFGPPETVMTKTFVWPGVGESDAEFWLRGALRAVIQEMREPPESRRPGAPVIGGSHTISETGDIAL